MAKLYTKTEEDDYMLDRNEIANQYVKNFEAQNNDMEDPDPFGVLTQRKK